MRISLAQLPELAALLAVIIAWWGVRRAAQRSSVAARLSTVYFTIGGLMALRLLGALFPGSSFIIAGYMIFASWLPLAALLLVEELCRRHAPRFVKYVALGGAVAFTLIALSLGLVWDQATLILLAAYQAASAIAMAALIWGSRQEMSFAEQRVANTFLLAILLTIPLALTDFDAIIEHAPVRGGAFAALVLVLGTSRLVRGDGTPGRLLYDIALCLGGSGFAAGAAWLIARGNPETDALIAAAATGFLVTALAFLIERFSSIRSDDERLVRALANMPDTAGADELTRAHPLLSSGRVVDGDMLANYPQAAVTALARHRVVDRDVADIQVQDAARDILEASAATHLLRLSIDPPQFLAVSAGDLAGAALRDELVVAAMLMETRK